MEKKNAVINKSINKKSSFQKYVLCALMIVIGLTGGYFLGFFIKKHQDGRVVKDPLGLKEVRAGGYRFINPLLECDNRYSATNENLVRLQNSLNEYIDNALKTGIVTHISVYYRSLNNGPWLGINENYNYQPASLLKVPLLIAVLKKAESDTTFLHKKILYDKILNCVTTYIVDKESLILGNTYTVNQLLEYMIIHSDNDAKEILYKILGEAYIHNVMAECGMNLDNVDMSMDFITVKEYSSFFRILYNSSYLNRDMSEKALELLSRVAFNEGIPAKLPKNIKVAHKYGERAFIDNDIKQFHDCGIVYAPNSPYLICVMTKGKDFGQLVKIIADISGIVYDAVGKD
ncbi:MAG TPA: class A beta-lactamase-related serine hydrolase [Bacteroidales bacterium]|nr:class A beta-lactamase-related serine hydrolase [Bacteroidales bacterium]